MPKSNHLSIYPIFYKLYHIEYEQDFLIFTQLLSFIFSTFN